MEPATVPHGQDTTRRRFSVRAVGQVVAWICWLLSLGPALVLAALRLADPAAPRLIEAISFTPSGGIGAMVALCLTPVVARRRPLRAVLGAAAALVLALHTTWQAPLFLGSAPALDPGCRIPVMSQNFEYGQVASLAEIVAAEQVDVLVVVVEARGATAAQARAELTPQLPHAAGVTAGRWNNAVVLSRFPVLASATSADARSSWARVQTPCLGAVDVLAIHPTPPYAGTAWRRDFALIHDFVQDRVGAGLGDGTARVIAMGDLNATLDHAPLRHLLEVGLRDAAEAVNAGWMPTYPAPGSTRRWGLPVPPLVPIDRVLVGAGLAVGGIHTVQVTDSDHLGVVATVGAVAR